MTLLNKLMEIVQSADNHTNFIIAWLFEEQVKLHWNIQGNQKLNNGQFGLMLEINIKLFERLGVENLYLCCLLWKGSVNNFSRRMDEHIFSIAMPLFMGRRSVGFAGPCMNGGRKYRWELVWLMRDLLVSYF